MIHSFADYQALLNQSLKKLTKLKAKMQEHSKDGDAPNFEESVSFLRLIHYCTCKTNSR